jgi:branched-chain amino acid transport system permease protein
MLQQAIDVLATGAIGALLASGVALVWSVRRVLPLQIAGLAALASAGTLQLSIRTPIHPWAALAIAVGTSMAVALGLDWLIDRPLRRRPAGDALLASTGGLALIVGLALNLTPPTFNAVSRHADPAALPLLDLSTLLLAALLLGGLLLTTKYLKLGLAMRTVAYHPDTAALMGINPDRIILWSVALGSALVATGGGLAVLQHAQSIHRLPLLLPMSVALTAAVIGGTKRLRWPVIAGAALGCLDRLIAVRWPHGLEQRLAVPLVCLLLLFLIRPRERPSFDAAEPA